MKNLRHKQLSNFPKPRGGVCPQTALPASPGKWHHHFWGWGGGTQVSSFTSLPLITPHPNLSPLFHPPPSGIAPWLFQLPAPWARLQLLSTLSLSFVFSLKHKTKQPATPLTKGALKFSAHIQGRPLLTYPVFTLTSYLPLPQHLWPLYLILNRTILFHTHSSTSSLCLAPLCLQLLSLFCFCNCIIPCCVLKTFLHLSGLFLRSSSEASPPCPRSSLKCNSLFKSPSPPWLPAPWKWGYIPLTTVFPGPGSHPCTWEPGVQ